jgi:hypothetical protein
MRCIIPYSTYCLAQEHATRVNWLAADLAAVDDTSL